LALDGVSQAVVLVFLRQKARGEIWRNSTGDAKWSWILEEEVKVLVLNFFATI